MAYLSKLYLNRNDGIVFGFAGKSFKPVDTNWTNYEENDKIEVSKWNKEK